MALLDHTPEPWIPEDSFAARLALVRVHLGGWNVAKTARFCGIDDQTWRNWEAGGHVRDMEGVCRKIANAVGCSGRWLMVGGQLNSGQNWKNLMCPDLRVLPGGAEEETKFTSATRGVQRSLPFHIHAVPDLT